MNWEIFAQIEEILTREKIRPILAVVPDNRDKELSVNAPNPAFWQEVRKWQGWGWTIGLHGYQHTYVTSEAGILRLNWRSEFAGLSLREQKEKIKRGVRVFCMNGVNPDLWIAPAHSFDAHTIQALLDEGVRTISDGFFLYPHSDGSGVFWIPQQLWHFTPMRFGVWTVCMHHNDWDRKRIREFGDDVVRFKDQITTVETVANAYRDRTKGVLDALLPAAFRTLRRLRALARRQAWPRLLPKPRIE
jgi:predicted deacetylase